MTREDTLRRIAALCRRDHWTTLYVLAYVTAELPTEQLALVLEAAEEAAKRPPEPVGHLALVRERFGTGYWPKNS